VFIDATGDIRVARQAGLRGCEGAEPKSRYGEPHAPELADPKALNAMNWCYRVRIVRSPSNGRMTVLSPGSGASEPS